MLALTSQCYIHKQDVLRFTSSLLALENASKLFLINEKLSGSNLFEKMLSVAVSSHLDYLIAKSKIESLNICPNVKKKSQRSTYKLKF